MAFDPSVFTVDANNLSMRIAQTRRYLEEYEKEVARAQGASGYKFYNKEDALGRIKVLYKFAPDNPEVLDFYERARLCVVGGAGNVSEVDAKYTQYLVNEEQMRARFAEISEKAWNEICASHAEETLEKVFPAPDYKDVDIEDMMGKYVILDEIMYPDNQFYGATGEYIYTGKRSTGMYFLKIDGRQWLAPYEAVKRYRNQVDTTMNEVRNWCVLGKIVDFTGEIPEAGEKKTGSIVMAWVVEPVALYVPGHVMAITEEYDGHAGKFVGEEEVEAIKDAWYTVKSVPDDVNPEQLMEIYMSAIKEKNFKLFLECIEPKRQETPVQKEMIDMHWEFHQERFHGEYVHANILPEKTKITVLSGFDEESDDNFFLTDEDVAKMKQALGEKMEEAIVYTAAFDKNGKQLGTPAGHTLKKVGGGRWYIYTYEVRF